MSQASSRPARIRLLSWELQVAQLSCFVCQLLRVSLVNPSSPTFASCLKLSSLQVRLQSLLLIVIAALHWLLCWLECD